jgi:hypothetical protein
MHQNAAVLGKWFWRSEAVFFRSGPGWRVRELSELPPSDQVAVVRAVEGGKAVSDPRLAPCVLACANAAMASAQRLQVGRGRWVLLPLVAIALVSGVVGTIAGTASEAVSAWLFTLMPLGLASVPMALARQRARAQAAADLAADQIARSSGDYPPSTMPS